MEKNLSFDDFRNIDLGKGQFTKNKEVKKYKYADVIMNAVWPGGISLEVVMMYGCYNVNVYKDDTTFQSFHLKSAEAVLSFVQNLAKNINDGKFSRKKTDKERAVKVVEDRNLTGCMNNTKWKALLDIVENRLPFPPAFVHKTLFDNPDSNYLKPISEVPDYYGDYGYEGLGNKHYLIEWIRITPKAASNIGGILVPKIEIEDETEELIRELEKERIPYEVEGNDVVIYGYR